MSSQIILVQPFIATADQKDDSIVARLLADPIGMGASGVLFLLLIASLVYSNIQKQKFQKEMKFRDFKNQDIQKKLKTALQAISKMEKNPDLIHSREFNLDYLRMRMEEENFHFAVVNQIKVTVKEKITLALRPNIDNRGGSRLVDEIFDVTYETGEIAKLEKRVLFRIQIKLTKIPTQATSKTISQIIDCLENYLTAKDDNDNWQPTIQGRVASIHWDQTAKPTPLLVLEQSSEGVNVTFSSRRPTRKPGSTNMATAVTGNKTKTRKSKSGKTKTAGRRR